MNTFKWYRFTVMLVFVLTLSLLPVVVLGDMIYEPQDDFHSQHYKECKDVQSFYTANKTAAIWESPDSSNQLISVYAQTKLFVFESYTDENQTTWGLIEYTIDENGTLHSSDKYRATQGTTGWIDMSEFTLSENKVKNNKSDTTAIIIVILVGIAVAATAVLIHIFMKKRK